jgi:hypothetical protein
MNSSTSNVRNGEETELRKRKHLELVQAIQARCIPLPEQLDTIMMQISDINKHISAHESQISDLKKLGFPSLTEDTFGDDLTYLPNAAQTYWKTYQDSKNAGKRARSSNSDNDGTEKFIFDALLSILGMLVEMDIKLNNLSLSVTSLATSHV